MLRRALVAALDNVVCDHPEHAGIDTELYINKNRKLKILTTCCDDFKKKIRACVRQAGR